MSHQGSVINPDTDNRVKYNLDKKEVSSAMKKAGVRRNADLHPGSEHGPAKDIANELGMDGDDRNVRGGIDRFIHRENVIPHK